MSREAWAKYGRPRACVNCRPSRASGLSDADVTVAGDQIWLVYRTSPSKLFQQRFNLDGSPSDDQPTQVNYLRANNNAGRGDWMTIGAMTMLTLLILVALLRRRAATRGDDDGDQRMNRGRAFCESM